jgi:crotonobetainyl-CoA:carnitine CoA-transferase CaiB-like acyl-CoA transferase
MCHFNLDSFTHYFSVGEVMGPLSRPMVSQSYTFPCSDGKWVAIHLSSPPKFWEGLVASVGLPELLTDPRFAERTKRIENQQALIDLLRPVFQGRTRDEWCEILLANEVPHSPAYDSDEALEDPQAVHLGIKVSAEHPEMGTFTTVRAPYNFDGGAELSILPPPTLDEHGDEIRAEIEARKAR